MALTTTDADLDAAVAALGDRTRRAILGRLAKGEATVGELAEPFALTHQAISRHVGILRRCGLHPPVARPIALAGHQAAFDQLAPQGLLNATRDPEIVTTWWRLAPHANIGVPTGALSGLVVLDVDVIKYGEDSLFELTQRFGQLPVTVMALRPPIRTAVPALVLAGTGAARCRPGL